MTTLDEPKGFNIHSHYEFRETLGRGNFGKVKRAVHIPTGEVVAIKIMNKTELGVSLLLLLLLLSCCLSINISEIAAEFC